ncbi:uncharacterized protein LOC132920045 [Rhopalosiphum padi]|uniref:uncharacterized protein LOC132920045 n=1 Tax=Rhopalosiphum padi TaxID=40932 RepID=UPI00298DC0A2|nr:uncharacterized protein LOC132920045 [Rhopalosiphum padi]
MIACRKSGGGDDDDGTPKSRSGCARRARQADWTVLVHGLCAAIIALTTLRILPALAACLVSVCFLQSPVLRTLSRGLFRFLGLRGGHRSAKPNAGNSGTRHGGRRRSPLAPQAPSTSGDGVPPPAPLSTNGDEVPPPTHPSTSGGDVLPRSPSTNSSPVVKRSLRLLMPVMRGIQRSIVIRPKRSRRSSLRRCRDNVSKATVTTVTACDNIITKTVETVSSYRADNDAAHHCGQYLQCATKEHR